LSRVWNDLRQESSWNIAVFIDDIYLFFMCSDDGYQAIGNGQ